MIACHLMVLLVKQSRKVEEEQDPQAYVADGAQHNAHNTDEEGSLGALTSLAVEASSMEDFHMAALDQGCNGKPRAAADEVDQ